MRILIATDGSANADQAVRLVESQPWPNGTSFRVLVVDDGRLQPMGISGGPEPVADYLAAPGDPDEIARQAAGYLLRPGWTADWDVARGRAASVIIDTARAVDADLIALGSRGRGRLGALILGSVSAEVVSHAPMSVLVARSRGPFRRVVLADDGSPAAARAREIVGTWAVFTHAAITVACVAYAVPVLVSVLPPASTPLLGAHPAGTIAEARRRRDRILDEAGRALEARGRHVQLVGGEGDPAARILDVAADVGADLIVSGSRGLSGVDQVLVGSVARNLLHAATWSILIARS